MFTGLLKVGSTDSAMATKMPRLGNVETRTSMLSLLPPLLFLTLSSHSPQKWRS
jgi:hypothetical protein